MEENILNILVLVSFIISILAVCGLSKPEVTTEPCLFNIYFDKEEQEKLGQKINLE